MYSLSEEIHGRCAFDEIIEYCPETEDEDAGEITSTVADCEQLQAISQLRLPTPPPREVFVCKYCGRMYDLMEDLRGHFIYYHNLTYLALPETQREAAATSETVVCKPKRQKLKVVARLPMLPASAEKDEMRPVPFKDFRLILRSKMTIRCSVAMSCGYKFENDEKLALHLKCHNVQFDKQFQCFECGTEMPNWRRCSAHLWRMHQVDVDLLHCPICTYKSHNTVLVWRHMRAHKKWRPRVVRYMRLVNQRLQQNAKKPAQVKHSAQVNKNKYYAEKTCGICERKFVNGKTLSKHVKAVHNKLKPFICNVCGQKMGRKASLMIHTRQHTGEKPLQCRSCKFSTRDPSVLRNHQLRHNKIAKLKCSVCAYACIQAAALKRHLHMRHPEVYKTVSCDLCNFVTLNAQKLLQHKSDHTKGLIVNNEDSIGFKDPKLRDKNNEISADCFMPLESIDSLPHEPALDTGGVTIPAPPSEDTQFPTYLNM